MKRYTHIIWFRAFDRDEVIKIDGDQVMDRTRMRREVRDLTSEEAFLQAYEVKDNRMNKSLGVVTLQKDWTHSENFPKKVRPPYKEKDKLKTDNDGCSK